ncbi:MAG: long-chain fatty acid--CoA ligase [Mycobacteriaceae bacterium]
MREFSVPSAITVGDRENLTDAIFVHASSDPDRALFRRPSSGQWRDVSAATFAADVTGVAKGLLAAGVAAGERVALLCSTRYEWTLLDYAIWCAGAVTVPIYESSSALQVQWILEDSGAVGIVVETDAHAATVASVRAQCPAVLQVWQIDGVEPAVASLTHAGTGQTDDGVGERRSGLGADDLATMIYTSGTTGRPKGCELTHRNLLFEVRSATAAFPGMINPGETNLCFLPMAHVFARAIAVAAVESGVVLGHSGNIKNLLDDLAAFSPTFLLAVPRVFEKVYNGARQKAHAGGRATTVIFDAADATAVAYSEALDSGRPGLGLRARHAVFDKLVYAKLRAAVGGRCTASVAGGAPLGARLGHFFRGVGLPVYEGYGLTETSAAITANTPAHQRIGTVGRPLEGCAVRIAEDSEVLVRGGMVFSGYWRNPVATAESFVDGWFRTGDLGSLDADGFLTITGRKKDIIVTAGGKNVAPAVLEDKLRSNPLISQCMVVGDQKPFIGALVTIDAEAFPTWLAAHDKPAGSAVADLVDDPDLRTTIDAAVAEANTAVSRAEAIKSYRILPVDFTEEGGEMTPTLKIKRAVVADHFADAIEAIYA